MTTVVGILMLLITAWLLYFVVRQHMRGEHPLPSIRNAIIVGFIFFQLYSGGMAMLTGVTTPYSMQDFSGAAAEYGFLAVLFLGSFLATYRLGFGVPALARAVPTSRSAPNDALLWMIAVALAVLGYLGKFGVFLPLIGVLTGFSGMAYAALSMGIVGWIWGRRLFNPIVIAAVFPLLAFNAYSAMAAEFGRRPLVSVAACMLWGMFFSSWRHLPIRSQFMRLAVFGTIPVILLALFTAVRGSFKELEDPGSAIATLKQGELSTGLELILSPGDTGPASLFLCDRFPGSFETRPLHTFRYFLVFAIPREMYPDKGWPLSSYVADYAQMRGVRLGRRGVTIGPGIIGHAAAEGGWYAAVFYGIWLALTARFLDDVMRRNLASPFVVLPIASTFGHIFGAPRGETGVFMFIGLWGIFTSWLTMILLSKLFERSTESAHIHHLTEDEVEADQAYALQDDHAHHGDDHHEYDEGYTRG